jgi:hypothetical protein
MQLRVANPLVLSNVQYLRNSASGFENIVIFGPIMLLLGLRLLSFDDIRHRRRPNDAP